MKYQERIQQREKELEELRAAVESHKVSCAEEQQLIDRRAALRLIELPVLCV